MISSVTFIRVYCTFSLLLGMSYFWSAGKFRFLLHESFFKSMYIVGFWRNRQFNPDMDMNTDMATEWTSTRTRTLNTDTRHRDTDISHGHNTVTRLWHDASHGYGHWAWTWTLRTDMDTAEGHGHQAQTWTPGMDTSHEHQAWTWIPSMIMDMDTLIFPSMNKSNWVIVLLAKFVTSHILTL
jgi:hypothetical protein